MGGVRVEVEQNLLRRDRFSGLAFWRRPSLVILVAVWTTLPCVAADDWPTYGHDPARSAASGEPLAEKLAELWTLVSRVPPTPAWDEPAIWDGWSKIVGLKNRQVFDKALQVIAVGDAVYFGSSVDDKVYCLEADTGRIRWTFFTEGPVRLAPTYEQGKLYVGSDDGYVYCLDAANGDLVWSHRPGPSPRRIPGNGRIISLWPIRTGVIAFDGTVYCCAGVIPSETVYLCALDAASGKEQWKVSFQDLPAQGYMLASKSRLYVTAGRDRPVVFERATGKRLHQVSAGTGGTYALLTGDTLLFGPNKTGEIDVVGAGPQDHLATFNGNHMIVSGGMSYLQTDNEISSVDRATYLEKFAEREAVRRRRDRLAKELEKVTGADAEPIKQQIVELGGQYDDLTEAMRRCSIWKVSCDCPLALILCHDRLVAGGDGKVTAMDTQNGESPWTLQVPGKVYGLAACGGRLYVSTDRGGIHCFGSAVRTAADSRSPEKPYE
jgi:hypothetical protein